MKPPGFTQVNNQRNLVNQCLNRNNQLVNSNQAPTFQPTNSNMGLLNDFQAYTSANEALMKNLQNNVATMQSKFDYFQRDQANFQKNFHESQRKNENFQNLMMNFIQSKGNNQAFTSSNLPSNTVPNPRGERKGITTRSGVVIDGP